MRTLLRIWMDGILQGKPAFQIFNSVWGGGDWDKTAESNYEKLRNVLKITSSLFNLKLKNSRFSIAAMVKSPLTYFS